MTNVVLPLAAMLLAGGAVTVKFAPFVPSIVTPEMLRRLVVLLLRIVKVFDKVLPTLTLPYATVPVPSVKGVSLGCLTLICVTTAAGASRTANTGYVEVYGS